jgi:hypothetical protein
MNHSTSKTLLQPRQPGLDIRAQGWNLEPKPYDIFYSHFACLVCWLGLSLVLADPADNTYTLESLSLCADADSVQIQADPEVLERNPNLDQNLYDTLMTKLKVTLQGSGIDITFQPSCKAEVAYTLLSVHLHYLDPSVYTEYTDDAYSYAVYMQVGNYAPKSYLASEYTLPLTHFLSFFEEVYTLPAGITLAEQVSNQSTAKLLELATAWWDDNPKNGQWTFLPQILGALLALGLVTSILFLRYRRSNTKLQDTVI